VWEWCWDWYGDTYPTGGTIDPKGPAIAQRFRLQRGASFGDRDFNCWVGVRLSDLYMTLPDYREASPVVGFRCVKK
jgi:formylglycine-generating enzyme required for sulfatase activity